MLTAAEPNLAYFQDLVGYDKVEIEEISEQLGSLAIQGPRAHAVLSQLAPEVSGLGYFDHTPAKVGNVPVTISRTGFTGDLGFEVFCESRRRQRGLGPAVRGRCAARHAAVRSDRAC